MRSSPNCDGWPGRDASQRARTQNERAREGARANELATFAAFLESVQFHDKKPELTRTGDEAQPVFPHPENFWPGRALLKAWEDMHASLIRLTRLFPHNPPPRDLAWEAEMEKWADLTRARRGGSEELTTQGGKQCNTRS